MMVRLPRSQTDSRAAGSSRTTIGLPLNRGAAATHSAAAPSRPGEVPSSEAVEDDARAGVPSTTPPRDQSQRRRAEKTTVRPPVGGRGTDDNE
jgi:hypothetical protein